MINNMLKLVVSIGLICALVPEAQSIGLLSKLFGTGRNVDFEAFDKWLTRRWAGNNVQENLDFVKEYKSELTDPKVSRSAEIFVSFLEGAQCNNDMLMYARDMKRNKVELGGSKRYQRLMKSRLKQVLERCSEHIGQELKREYNTRLVNRGVARFLEEVVLRPHYWSPPVGNELAHKPSENFISYTLDPRSSFELGPNLHNWRDYLQLLVGDEQFSKVYHVHWDKDRSVFQQTFNESLFRQVYTRYIIEPCKALLGLEDIVKGIYAMSELRPSVGLADARKLTSKNSRLVLQLLYGYKACQDLDNQGNFAMDLLADNLDLDTRGRHGQLVRTAYPWHGVADK